MSGKLTTMKKHTYFAADLQSDENKDLKKELKFKPLITQRLGTFSFIHSIGTKLYFRTGYKSRKGRIIIIDAEKPQ